MKIRSDNYHEIMKAAAGDQFLYANKKGAFVAVSRSGLFSFLARIYYVLNGYSREEKTVAAAVKDFFERHPLKNLTDLVWTTIGIRELATHAKDDCFSKVLETLQEKCGKIYAQIADAPKKYFARHWVDFLRSKKYSIQEIKDLWKRMIAQAPALNAKLLHEMIQKVLASPKALKKWFSDEWNRKVLGAETVKMAGQAVLEPARSNDSETRERNAKLWNEHYRASEFLSDSSMKGRVQWLYGLKESDWVNWDWTRLMTLFVPKVFAAEVDRKARECLFEKTHAMIQRVCRSQGVEYSEAMRSDLEKQWQEIYSVRIDDEIGETHRSLFGPGGHAIQDVWESIVGAFVHGDLEEEALLDVPRDREEMEQRLSHFLEKSRKLREKLSESPCRTEIREDHFAGGNAAADDYTIKADRKRFRYLREAAYIAQ